MHFIYVAGGDQFVKVGLTSKPKARARAISASFRQRGDCMKRFVFFPGLPAAYGLESSLCRQLTKLAARVDGREWFIGLDMPDVIAIVKPAVMDTRRFQLGNRYFRALVEKERRRKAKATA